MYDNRLDGIWRAKGNDYKIVIENGKWTWYGDGTTQSGRVAGWRGGTFEDWLHSYYELDETSMVEKLLKEYDGSTEM
jgi:hypothetical protein